MTIATPPIAEKISETSQIQKKLIRDSIGVNDFPIQTDKTYIVFDADAGNNNLFIDIDASLTYSVMKGDGSQPVSFTDVGGAKTLNYTNAGRYIITIEGDFNGLDLAPSAQADKDKIISVIGGSNYPTTIVPNAYKNCHELQSISFPFVTTTDSNCFELCTELIDIHFPIMTSIGQQSFISCTKIEYVNFPLADFSFSGGFSGCTNLREVILPSVTNISTTNFQDCVNLRDIYVPSISSVFALINCTKLEKINCYDASVISFSGCTSLKEIHLKSVVTIGALTFSNVILTDIFVNGTEAQAITIQDDIVAGGGFFAKNSRFIYESQNLANIITWKSVVDGIAYLGNKAGFGTDTLSHKVTIESAGDNIVRVVAKGTGFGGSSIFEIFSERTSTTPNPVLNVGSAFSTDAFLVETSGEFKSLPTYNNVTGSAANVFIDTSGRFYRSTSSEKLKTDIKNIDPKYSENIYKIAKESAIFYKSLGKHDNPDWTFYGLSAEKLALIDPRLVHFGYWPEDYEILSKDIEVEEIVKSKNIFKKDKKIIVTKHKKYKALKKDAKMTPVGTQDTKIIPLMLIEANNERVFRIKNTNEIENLKSIISDQNKKIENQEKRLLALEKK